MHCAEPPTGLLVGFKCAVAKDVHNRDTGRHEGLGNENGAVTVERFPLRTHDGDPMVLPTREEPVDPRLVGRRLGESLVLDLAVDVASWVVRAGAELTAEE